MLFLIIATSCAVSGQQRPNLIIGGIWQTSEDQAANQKYADALDAEYVPTYYSRTENPYATLDKTTITGKLLADVSTDEALAADAAAKVVDVSAVDDATPMRASLANHPENSATAGGVVYRGNKNPSPGAPEWAKLWIEYMATNLNGLTDERLNPSNDGVGDHYVTIYAHSGGARTAVTALLYQGVTADRLVLISPARGIQDQKDYNKDLQRLLDSGIVKEIVVYQSESDKNGIPYDNPTAAGLWQGRFKEGDVKGNFEIIPLTWIELLGKTRDAAHIQMWESALCKDSEAIQDLVYPATQAPDQVSRSYAVIADESTYTSEIPVGDTQTKHFSTADTPPGKVALSIDIRDKNGNIVPAGTKVTVKDGSGEYVQVDWSSIGQTLAFGAPGNWIITVDAPGYKTNTRYVEVSSASSSTSFTMYLQEGGANSQPPANQPFSASKLTQSGIGTPLLSPSISDRSSGMLSTAYNEVSNAPGSSSSPNMQSTNNIIGKWETSTPQFSPIIFYDDGTFETGSWYGDPEFGIAYGTWTQSRDEITMTLRDCPTCIIILFIVPNGLSFDLSPDWYGIWHKSGGDAVSPTVAGVGTLIDEGQNGGGGW